MASNADVKKKNAMLASATIAVEPAIATVDRLSSLTAGSIGRRARRESSRLRYARAQKCPGVHRNTSRAIRTAWRLIEFAAAAEPAGAGDDAADPPITTVLLWEGLCPTLQTPMQS